MNAAALELPNALRNLVDCRLDAIERALLQGNTSRAERASILEDIETQIIEMLSAEAEGHEPARADLLRVFARLDPPEAFAGEPIESARRPGSARPSPLRGTGVGGEGEAPMTFNVPPTMKAGYSTTGILACMGGLTTLALGMPLCGFSMAISESEILALIAGGFVAMTGIPAMVLGILYAIAIHQSAGRLRGLTCAAIGISALPICVIGLLGGFLAVVSRSEFAIYGFFVFICVLAVVGAIHLTYRSLELVIGVQRRPM